MNKKKLLWLDKCKLWKEKWNVIQKKHLNDKNGISIYNVMHFMNNFTTNNNVIVGDAGSISYVGPVALEPKKNQRFIFSSAQADMGWALPASIGISLSLKKKNNVFCVTGDGSFMSNIQELSTIKYLDLNIKIFLLNNKGYLSIKNTQNNYFGGRVFGAVHGKGFIIPDFKKISRAFGIDYCNIKKNSDFKKISKKLFSKKPLIIDISCKKNETIEPYQALKNGKQAGPHDMYPHLDTSEIKSELFVNLPVLENK